MGGAVRGRRCTRATVRVLVTRLGQRPRRVAATIVHPQVESDTTVIAWEFAQQIGLV